jgi:hypothetical protein
LIEYYLNNKKATPDEIIRIMRAILCIPFMSKYDALPADNKAPVTNRAITAATASISIITNAASGIIAVMMSIIAHANRITEARAVSLCTLKTA